MEKQKVRRAERQPLGTFNCGSVFKNPPGDQAGRLIEAAGLKGRQMGGARISPKHANFIENTGGASARDVRALIDLARRAVKEKFNKDLEPEVWAVGEE
jgi:UDP-N-acetylmuramate dehydrogenase